MKAWLKVNVAPVQQQIEALRQTLTPANFQKCMAIAVMETGTRLKTQIWNAIKVDYNAKKRDVMASIGSPRFTGQGASVSCVLNIRNTRINIPNSGGGNKRRKRAIYAVKGLRAKIAKGDAPLPTSGPKAHFVKRSTGQVIVFTGGTFTMKEKFHTEHATEKLYTVHKKAYRQGVAIGIPQMPMNRSADRLEKFTQNMLVERLTRACYAMGAGKIKPR
jgi:hypothetical protein